MKNKVLRNLDEEGESSLSFFSLVIFLSSQSLRVPVWLLVHFLPAVIEIIGPVACRPHARWAVCCHPIDYLPAWSLQNDQTIAKLSVTSLPDLAFFFSQIYSLKTETSKIRVKAFFSAGVFWYLWILLCRTRAIIKDVSCLRDDHVKGKLC